MNKVINKFLLAGDKSMPEMHLKQPRFTYSSCEPFNKNKEEIKKSKETKDSRYIYQNEVDIADLEHDMAYGNFKDLNRRTAANKLLLNKAFNIAKSPKCDSFQHVLDSMVYKFLIKKTSGTRFKNEITSNKVLAEELRKPIIRKFVDSPTPKSTLTFCI